MQSEDGGCVEWTEWQNGVSYRLDTSSQFAVVGGWGWEMLVRAHETDIIIRGKDCKALGVLYAVA